MRRTVEITLLLLAICSLGAQGQERRPTPRATPSPANQPAPRDINVRATTRPVDASVPDDPAVIQAIAPYRARVAALQTVIGRLERELR